VANNPPHSQIDTRENNPVCLRPSPNSGGWGWGKLYRFFVILSIVSLLLTLTVSAQAPDGYIRAPRLGVTFINSVDHPNDTQRYEQGLLIGAGWTRYPIYWDRVEVAPGQLNWAGYDQLVANDLRYGLRINAILLGIPGFFRDGESIANLNAPVFADGTDTPGPGKAINPANHFAAFVLQAVNRYKPGGILPRQLGLTGGISVWEAWNEPDLTLFWSAGIDAYARLLKVAYLSVHAADPFAQVMIAGMAYVNPDQNDYLDRTLAIIARDPARATNNWYFDIAAVHAYTSARRSGLMVSRMRQTLRRYGLTRPVWLNESGIPVWNDYPGPTWTGANPNDRLYRGTLNQQAAYVIQSTVYAWAAGADVVFFHQLYDDCGNQSGGTDFAPNSGGAGDAHGLFRNQRGSSCFSQHPQPGSARPAATAYRVLAQLFGGISFGEGRLVNLQNRATVVVFDRLSVTGAPGSASTTDRRLYVMWSRDGERLNVQIPSSGGLANLYTIDNQDFVIAPENGEYKIGLQPAIAEAPNLPSTDFASIGGAPYILVEQLSSGAIPPDPALIHLEGVLPDPNTVTDFSGLSDDSGWVAPILATLPPPPEQVTPTATLPPTIRPTTDPAFDTTAPITYMGALPLESPSNFGVTWGAQDDGGIAAFILWVRIDDGDWTFWIETTDAAAMYTGEVGRRYEFAVWARDLAGNWSPNTTLSAQASTTVR